jgi:hypothetical protein
MSSSTEPSPQLPRRRASLLRQLITAATGGRTGGTTGRPARFTRLAASLRLPHYCGSGTITRPTDRTLTDTRSLPRPPPRRRGPKHMVGVAAYKQRAHIKCVYMFGSDCTHHSCYLASDTRVCVRENKLYPCCSRRCLL